jgi:large subunit ribosomal protein L18
MKNIKLKNLRRERRRIRNRAKIFGTRETPRLSIFRSNKYIYAQLIDDTAGKTLLSVSTRELKSASRRRAEMTKTEQSRQLGEIIGEKAGQLGIKKAVFNKGQYSYHGRVKAVAEGARSKNLSL